jgi:F-box interacting protein
MSEGKRRRTSININLGEDLEEEILIRLPAKSLMRFKCVQRSWNNLFKTPLFVYRNMNIHMSKDDHHRFIIIDQHTKETCPKTHNHDNAMFIDKEIEPTCLETHLMLLSLPDKLTPTLPPTPNVVEYSLFPNIPIRTIRLYGHCNGVLCLEYDYYNPSLVLWNPTTREVHFVPTPPTIHPEYMIGFGAKSNTNDFKVIKLNINREKTFVFSLLSIEIYNLNNKSWTINHNPILPPDQATMRYYHKRPNKYNILVNGIYHWITGYNVKGFSIILSYDFSNNKFHTIVGPVSRLHSETGQQNLTQIKGSLACVVQLRSNIIFGMAIWVMDKHGWTKLYNLVPLEMAIHKHAIFCKGKNGVQFLGGKPGQPLTLYDHHGNLLCQFQILLHGLFDSFLVHEYVQSIAPLSA